MTETILSTSLSWCFFLQKSRFLFIRLHNIICKPRHNERRPAHPQNSSRKAFVLLVIFQTSESTLHSCVRIADTRTLSCHVAVTPRCRSLGAAGFQTKRIPVLLEREGLSCLAGTARPYPYLLHTTASEVPARTLYTKKTNKAPSSYLIPCPETSCAPNAPMAIFQKASEMHQLHHALSSLNAVHWLSGITVLCSSRDILSSSRVKCNLYGEPALGIWTTTVPRPSSKQGTFTPPESIKKCRALPAGLQQHRAIRQRHRKTHLSHLRQPNIPLKMKV